MQVLIAHSAEPESVAQIAALAASSGGVQQRISPRLTIASIDQSQQLAIESIPGVLAVFAGAAPDQFIKLTDEEELAVDAWNLRHSAQFRAAKQARPGEGRSWGNS